MNFQIHLYDFDQNLGASPIICELSLSCLWCDDMPGSKEKRRLGGLADCGWVGGGGGLWGGSPLRGEGRSTKYCTSDGG